MVATPMDRPRMIAIYVALLGSIAPVNSFVFPDSPWGDMYPSSSWVLLCADENVNVDALSLETFKRRKGELARKNIHGKWLRPPNPLLGPADVVSRLLDELRNSRKFSGATSLLETSTETWRDMLRRSVGAPRGTTIALLAPSLESALARPNNQFAILMGVEDENYVATFPTDPLEFDDTCWVECRLRSGDTDELLVAMGWSFEKRPGDGSWVISSLDWQDFRKNYRPGIGREEWERICG